MHNGQIVMSIVKVFEGRLNPDFLTKKFGRAHDGLVYYIDGETHYTFTDKTASKPYTATRGNVIYLAKDSIYDMDIRREGYFICVDFELQVCRGKDEPNKSLAFRELPADMHNRFIKLLHIWNENKPWSKWEAFGELYGIMTQCTASMNKKYNGYPSKFVKLSEFVAAHYTEPDFCVSKVADFAGITQVQLRRIFDAAVGMPPVRYINHLRLEKAKALLADTNMTIAEIAEASGISDVYYFSRLFKKEIGVSPTAFRSSGMKKQTM